EPLCSVAEVGNTFGEIKPYLMDQSRLTNKSFNYRTQKLFYVSPFISHDVDFDFRLDIPDEQLYLKIDDYKGEHNFFTAILSGKKKTMNNINVLKYALTFPLITLRIIALIHWEALKIWTQKIHYYKKSEFPELQVDVYNKNTNH
ncbi:MAG: DUF1365 domain-containing protein, partial [Cyclobacteriaceae bacterium]|nr:DUF1365 domain-containing protein [Cyclobacteriaceae bacterium]